MRSRPPLADRGLADQGVREIVALATAAQAFQVCTGTVEYSVTRKDGVSNERSRDTSAKFDPRDMISRSLGLAIGGLLGLGGATAVDREIPWIAKGPGVRGGYHIRGPISTVDTAATALEALGLPIPPDAVGKCVKEIYAAD